MNPEIDIDPKKRIAKGYDCENATFKKFGKEQSIRDYVQAGKDGTEIKELIQKAGGLEQLKRFNKDLPTADIEIDLNMNPIVANKIIKAGQVAKIKLDQMAAIKAEMENQPKTEPEPNNKGGEE